jgi:hypothetical protein
MHMSLLIILDTLLCIIILFINKLVSTFITKKYAHATIFSAIVKLTGVILLLHLGLFLLTNKC